MAIEMSTHEEFRTNLKNEQDILTQYLETWTRIMATNDVMPELVRDRARSAVGNATLLLRKKLKHFEEILNQAENKTSVKDISINDLLGYWETIESQLNEVKGLFETIDQFKTGTAK